ncbi:MAG: alternative ribosome rescue aminoacyl-tRNA hydrolase ArfB [Spirochaetia bacterium]
MISRSEIAEYVKRNTEFSFSRSGGPGGQNVNKLNTKVTARLPVKGTGFFEPEDEKRIHERLGNRINSEGELVLQVQEERSQNKNRHLAESRLINLISASLQRKKKRKPSKPSYRSRERRIAEKKHRGNIKKQRSPVRRDEE